MLKNLPFFFTTFLAILITTITSLNIPLNSSLTTLNPTQTWSSPSNIFTLHFIPFNSTSYTLSITYAKTSIWSPTSSAVSSGTFRLDSSGDLQLVSPDGVVAWHSSTSNLGITHAILNDEGSFTLMNGSNNVMWSTFDHPTDTFVTSQAFKVGMKLTSGLYSFFLNSTGNNMTLQWNDDIVYFSSGLNSSVSSNFSGNPELMLQDGILSYFDSNLNLLEKMFYGSDYGDSGDMLRFIRLDNDGNLRMYSVDSGSASSSVTWAAVSEQCLVFGYCGNMGICSYNETSPVCGCPSENFVAVDEEDSRKGCRLKEEIKDCPNNVGILEMDHTRFLNYPLGTTSSDVYYEGREACRENCLSGTSCVVSTSVGDGSGECYIKTSSFVSGYQSAAVPSTSYVKVCGPVVPNPPPSKETRENQRVKGWVIGVVILVTVVMLLLLEGSIWWWCCKKSTKFASLSAQYALLEYASGAPVQFSYRELQQATSGFNEKLGEGGFGTVYKGVLANRSLAAVKQLEGIEQGEKQFRMEVATISCTHHLNLVRLIGFCSEGRHRLLIYEFMKNGSLDSFLFGTERSREKLLTWENRFNIALGTAKGITYLHEECRDCIVHCDIKPENILLDDNYNAKVSDFGLAKLVSPKDHRYRTLTSVRGTRGYLPPEWLASLPITSKSDVYSFGMVLLEIVSGRRNFEVSEDTNRKKFSIWAYEEFNRGNISTIVDRRFGSGEVDMVQVTRAIQVSFWCIQEQPSQRPMMGKVVQMLEGIMDVPRPPTPKAAIDVSSSRASFNMSSISTRSTLAASGPDPSLSSSSQTQQALSCLSGVNLERPSSSVVHSE